MANRVLKSGAKANVRKLTLNDKYSLGQFAVLARLSKEPLYATFYSWASKHLTIEELKDEYAMVLSKQSQLSKRQRDIIEQLYMEKCQ